MGEARLVATLLTHSRHLLYLLSHRNQVDQVPELITLEVTIEPRHNHRSAFMSNSVDNPWQVFAEELCFIYANDF